MELIDTENGLLHKMYSAKIITARQRSSITRNDKLLDVVMRKSVAAFKNFVHCLDETGQRHVIPV